VKVTKDESVSCDTCGEFEMSKSYSGHPAGDNEYGAIAIPDECPVCGATLESDCSLETDTGQ